MTWQTPSAETSTRRVQRWTGRDVVVFDELVEVYGAAVQAPPTREPGGRS